MKKQNFSTSFGVIGLGRFGTALVRTLAEAGQEVIAVDKDEQKVKAVRKYTVSPLSLRRLARTRSRRPVSRTAGRLRSASASRVDVSILTTMMVNQNGDPARDFQGEQPRARRGAPASGLLRWSIRRRIWRCTPPTA